MRLLLLLFLLLLLLPPASIAAEGDLMLSRRNASGVWRNYPVTLPGSPSYLRVSGTTITWRTYAEALSDLGVSTTYAPLASPSFTGTLNIGGAAASGIFRISERTDQGGNYLEFRVPNFDDQNTVYTWPDEYGTNGYQLTTDGAGALTWAAAGSGGGSGAFSDAGDPAILNTTTKDVAIGAALINAAKFSIDGDADQVQLAIQGHSTQSVNYIEIENSAGTMQAYVTPNGQFFGNMHVAQTTVGGADHTAFEDGSIEHFASGIAYTYTMPHLSGDLVLHNAVQTLTNKSIVATQLTGIIADARMPDLTGDVTTSEGAVATTIANDAVTLAKMSNIDGTAAQVVLGRSTASSGDPELLATTGTRGTAVVLATSPTLVTPALGTIASGVGTALTALDGENIQAGTIDDDSLDLSVGAGLSGADIPIADAGGHFTTDFIEDALANLGANQAGFQPLDADLTDLADGTLTGSKVGTGINGENISDDTIDDDSIDFGTGADQVSAEDVPFADSGSIFAATNVETALLEASKIVTKATGVSYTSGTTNARESYGGIIYVTGAATITLPAVADGMSVTVITVGAVAVSVDPNAADKLVLDGVTLDDGDKATNTSTAGDIIVLTYYSADGWYAASDGWTDTGA